MNGCYSEKSIAKAPDKYLRSEKDFGVCLCDLKRQFSTKHPAKRVNSKLIRLISAKANRSFWSPCRDETTLFCFVLIRSVSWWKQAGLGGPLDPLLSALIGFHTFEEAKMAIHSIYQVQVITLLCISFPRYLHNRYPYQIHGNWLILHASYRWTPRFWVSFFGRMGLRIHEYMKF